MFDSRTLLTLLIGHPVSHSKSPVFQNAAFKKNGVNSVYVAVDIERENFKEVAGSLKKIDLFGINVTVPYKSDILEFIDELKDDARIINSVNTIEIKDKKWIGHNTDWYGVFKTLEKRKIHKTHNILIIGSGGATNGVIYGLQKYGIKNITITNRTFEKAKSVQKYFNVDIIDFEKYKRLVKNYSMIINTTTLKFNDLIDEFDDKTVYYDLKYYTGKPDAKNYIDGKDMLLYQGAKSFEIWTNNDAPLKIMQKSLR
jgi:shikimate dehydrogenase